MRKPQEDPVEEGAAWMTTYSDMVTLLFTFFVLMFAISSVDNGKFNVFIAAMQNKTGGLTADQFDAIRYGDTPADADLGIDPTEEPSEDPADPQDPAQPQTEEGGGLFATEPEEEPDPEDNADLEELHRMLGGYLHDENLEDSIYLHYGEGDGDSLLMRLSGDVWFAPGSAEVTPAMREVAVDIATMLKNLYNPEHPFRIAVSGHTDNVPQSSPMYPNNWHLSSGRANNFVWILFEETGIPASQFYTQGYGEERPIADNNTEEGRQLNRRVEILISQQRGRTPEETTEPAVSDRTDSGSEAGAGDEAGTEGIPEPIG